MNEKNRIFGNNLQVILYDKGIQPEVFAKQIGYSTQEMRRIMDARLFLTTGEKEEIANALDVTVDTLYQAQDDKIYERAGCLECRGKFSTPASQKKILDLFDVYCDTQELLAQEDLKELTIKSST